MATAVIMPRQGQSVESCIITTWNKKVGDTVNEGDVLFSYETDKSAFEEKAPVSGKLLACFYGEGDEVVCLENVCVIGADGEDISAFGKGNAGEAPKAEAPKAEEKKEAGPVASAAVAASAKAENGDKQGVSPRAKRLAESAGVNPLEATPTGPEGRIIERDINTLLDNIANGKAVANGKAAPAAFAPAAFAPATAADYDEIKLSNIRKTIAKTMHASLSEMAQLTMSASFDATAIMKYRAGVKANGEKMGLNNITLNDIVVYAAAKTLVDFPDINATFNGEVLRQYHTANVGVATDTERGLMVPTVFGAEKLSLNELSKTTKGLIDEARSGRISPDKLSGGTFAVTNLGSFGIESFTPVINPPQVAILGVCGLTDKVRKGKDGQMEIYSAMGLSLTVDHRVVDGAPAARFMKALCTNLENFDQLLAK